MTKSTLLVAACFCYIDRESPVLLTRQHRGSAEKREVENKKKKNIYVAYANIIPLIF